MTKVSEEAQAKRFTLLNTLMNAIKLASDSEVFTPHEKLSVLRAARKLIDEEMDLIVEELR